MRKSSRTTTLVAGTSAKYHRDVELERLVVGEEKREESRGSVNGSTDDSDAATE